MSTVELSHTVATLERTLAADDALAEAAALDPRLHARATKLRGGARRVLGEFGALLADTGRSHPQGCGHADRLATAADATRLRHLTARLSSYERRMAALTYDASWVDLGSG